MYGDIVDLPFLDVDPHVTEEEIDRMSDVWVEKIKSFHPTVVLCQGEFTLVYAVVQKLRAQGIAVLSACSQRNVVDFGEKKEVYYEFVQYRLYEV